jgi:hypothetical protein
MVTNCARCFTKSSAPDSAFCDGCLETIKTFYADAAARGRVLQGDDMSHQYTDLSKAEKDRRFRDAAAHLKKVERAGSGNYIVDDDTYPTRVVFADGRTVEIAPDPVNVHLVVGREYDTPRLPGIVQYNEGLEHAARIAVAQLTPPDAATPEGVAVAIRAAKVNPWTCKADRSGIGGNTPQDCDWPVCGCDPYADKVIAALQESGKLP